MALTDADGVAALLLGSLLAYGVLGGADFGGGIWDLLATGPRKAQQRDHIAHAMGPVWEANHVWLVFVIVILLGGFPRAYAALSLALFVPFHLGLGGIALRGAAFVFRAHSGVDPGESRWGSVFGAASVITPVLLGMCLSAVSSGALRLDREAVQVQVLPGPAAWLTPLAFGMGALALALCAYLAAVYLTLEAAAGGAADHQALREDFRTRALWSGGVVVALGALLLPLLAVQAPHLLHGLLSRRALPVVAVGTAAALVSGWALLRRLLGLCRAAAVVQVACLLGGLCLAQYPYLIYPDLTLAAGAAPVGTLRFLLYTLPFGVAFLLPSLWYLFHIFKSGRSATGAGG